MRFLIALFCLIATPTLAQLPEMRLPEPEKPAPLQDDSLKETKPVTTDWKALGKPVDNDIVRMRDRYVYFNIDADAKNVPLDHPVLSNPEIGDQIKTLLGQALTVSGKNYDTKLVQNQILFTPTGYGEFVVYLQNANMDKFLKNNDFKMQAFVEGTPEITAQGLRDIPGATETDPITSVYVWQATARVVFSYLDYRNEPPIELFPNKAKAAIMNRFPVEAKIELIRVPRQSVIRENDRLIAINRISFTPVTP